jgi:pilus assembly protein CpaE
MYPDHVPIITPTSSGVHVPSSAILLLEQDEVVGAVIRSVLIGVGYSVETVTDAAEAIRRASEYGLVIIDQIDASKNAADVCREVRGTPDLSAIPVLCICPGDDVEERIRFLEAGADDVMAKPFDARELEARVEALLLRFQRSRELAPAMLGDPAGNMRRMVAVFSPKGGVGTTTVAVNIAAAHAASRPDRVLIIDLALQFGQVATHLNLVPRQTLADLARDEQSQREPELLRTYATKHASGLHVLAAPGSPELAELVLPHHVERLLETALLAYDAIVIDAGSALNAHSLAALERAETVLLPVHPEVAALKAVHSLLDYLDDTGSIRTKATFVLNNAFARDILRMRDVESALGAKVTAELPYDGFLFLKAVNEGNPIILGAPRSPAAASLVALAAAAFGDTSAGSHAPSEEHRASRFGGLLRRT